MSDPLQLAKQFVKTVVRMFYETEHIVVVDALVFHGALTIQDLVQVLDGGKNQKGAQKITGKLREGGLISVFSRQEVREGAMKATNREYYYIDYRRAIDATKYRLHILDERIKKDVKPSQEKKEFNCKKCKAQWTALEVVDSLDPVIGRCSGFLCKKCGAPLDELHDEASNQESGDIPAKFNKFFKPILSLMQQIDDVVIPAIEGSAAVEGAIELPRDKELNPVARHEVVTAMSGRPTSVRGIASAPEKIAVSISTTSEQSETERIQEAQRQAKIAEQNLLPEWHTKSTITNQDYGAAAVKSELNGALTPSLKAEQAEEKASMVTDLDDIYAKIEADRRKQEEEEEDDDDDDDDEFEDVVVGAAAPDVGGLPDAKRVKMESSAAPSPANGVTPAASTGDGGDESDEDEFVDV